MSYNVWNKVTGRQPSYRWGVYGIEVEAERLLRTEADRLAAGDPFDNALLRTMQTTYWRAITDGSLRHNGVEFITTPSTLENSLEALGLLYSAMRSGLFSPSVRTGIHVHVNMSTLGPAEMLERMRAYAVLEPLLFQFVGEVREQNIYCVPLYRAENERRLWRRLAELLRTPPELVRRPVQIQMQQVWTSFCKYSALNLESFHRLGTFEFRHAPTFHVQLDAERWVRLVDAVMHFNLPPDATLESLAAFEDTARALIPGVDWARYLAEVEERDLLGFVASLQPFTYKVAEWGMPASMAFSAVPMAAAEEYVPTEDERDYEQRMMDEMLAAIENDGSGASPDEEVA